MNKQKIINIVMFAIVIVALSLSGYFYYQLRSTKINGNTNTSVEVQDLINKVSQLYLIPNGESPTVATVSDPSILKNQSFFTLSEKGDKVLIFNRAGKAILYRPSINKIIEIAPIKNNPLSSNKDVAAPKEKTE